MGANLMALLLAVGGLVYWWLVPGHLQIAVRVPKPVALPEPPPADAGQLLALAKLPSRSPRPDLPHPLARQEFSWPQFRGPDRTNVVQDPEAHLPWGPAGPKVLWKIRLGNGHAGAAIVNGRVYVLDHGETDGVEHDLIRCLALDPRPAGQAQELWQYLYKVDVPSNHGMSRGVPSVSQGCVVTMGPKCHVFCLNAETGERLWFKDVVRAYQLQREPPWYAAQCPLIDGDKVILAPGGRVLITALDLKTGKTLWETLDTLGPPVGKDWKGRDVWADMTHGSILPWTCAGTAMYVYAATNGVVAVDAQDGHVLWTYKKWRVPTANVPTPVPCGEGRLFFCGGYGAGSLLLKVEYKDGAWQTRESYRVEQAVFGSTQHTPILYQGLLYAVRPDGKLACLNAAAGALCWEYAERRHRTGAGGPTLILNGKLLVLQDSTVTLSVLALDPSGKTPPQEEAARKISGGVEAWATMAYADGRLVLRDEIWMLCLDLRGSSP